MSKIILLTSGLLTSLLLFSFLPADNTDDYQIESSDIAYVNKVLTNYLAQLNQGNIRLVSPNACSQSNQEKYRDLQSAGIYTYRWAGDTVITSDINNDGQPDYFYAYNGINCAGMRNESTYMSNFIIVSSSNSGLYVDENLTDKVKQAMITGINSQIGETGYDQIERARFMPGIRFETLRGDTLSASYLLHTPKCSSSQPCCSGRLNYNFLTNRVSVLKLNIEYWD